MLDGQREVESLHSFPSGAQEAVIKKKKINLLLKAGPYFPSQIHSFFSIPSYLGMNCCYSQDTQQRYGLMLGLPFLSDFWKDPTQIFEVPPVAMSQ